MLHDPTETDEVQPNVVGISTIHRYLHDSDLFEHVKRKKMSRLTDTHVAARLAWASAKQDSLKYVDTLSEFFLPFAHLHYGTEFVFQHDNATIHTATITKDFLEEMAVDTMPYPVRSSDLNPIENLWEWLVKCVYANGKQYCSANELKVLIEREWSMIPQELLQQLVTSMKPRCIATIVARGANTKY